MDELYNTTPDLLDSEAEEYEDTVADILSDGEDIDVIAGITDENEDEILSDEEPIEEDPEVVKAAQEVEAMDVGEYADYDIQAVEDEESEPVPDPAMAEAPEEDDDIPTDLFPDEVQDQQAEECPDGECFSEDEDDDDDDIPYEILDHKEEEDD